jgi:hypothetical protein
MRKVIFIIFSTLITCMLQAQIPNAGFESWTSMGTYEVPNQWGNMNTATSGSGVFTTAKGSPGASGSYFVKLTTKDVGGVITPGMIVSGQLNTTTWQPVSGFAYSQQAEKLKGKYQYMGYNNDSATISAWLTRWNTSLNRRDTIASLKKTTSGMVHVWTAFSIPFAYRSSEVPDTAVIMISSSCRFPKKNSFIWIDDLLLDGLVTSLAKDVPADDVKVFPSPAKDEVNITFNSKNNYDSRLQILDNVGKIVYQSQVEVQPGINTVRTDLNKLQLKPGLFFIRLESQGEMVTHKFIVSR